MYTILEHPLLQHRVTLLRDISTPPKLFRELAGEISAFLAYEAFRDLETGPRRIRTPFREMEGGTIVTRIVLVPILRAGMGMLDAVLNLVPYASVGVLGMQRNEETAEPIPYYAKLPKPDGNTLAVLLDPMLATGGSACDAVTTLKKQGYHRLIFLNLICCPEGLARLEREHPDVHVWSAVEDECLNERKYIVPGLGDAGDRLFGTL